MNQLALFPDFTAPQAPLQTRRPRAVRALRPLYLVACSKTKASAPAPAKELYQGALFGAARAYVEVMGGRWRILSALHGVVRPEAILAPYELCLAKHPNLGTWQQQVLTQLREEDLSGGVLFLCGATYRTWLEATLLALDVQVFQCPLDSKSIGQQIQWLKAQVHP